MALLQISEPGMSTAPHQHRLAIGIDLGTTHSLVASVSSGSAKVLSDEANKQVIPSIVHYMKDGTVLVGDAAQQTLNPSSSDDAVEQSDAVENTIYSVKRLLGRSYADLEGTSFSYTVKAGADETPLIETRHGEKNAVQVSADILNYLRELAEANLADTISGAVITVPAYFDEAQRQATKQAAQIAGIKVLRLLNEPTAAAIAYGLEQKQALQQGDEQHIIVYDLGGGTFDVSILLLKQGVYQVMATGGDTQLGGDDFDRLLAEYSANAFGIDISTLSPIDYSALMRSARAAKEQLSHANDSEIRFKTHAVRIDRDLCDTLFSPLIKKTLRACKRAMRDAELDLNSIDEIIMVGGSTRLLSVQSAVHQFFSKSLNNDIDPDKVVAIGAAVQADILIGNKSSEEVLLLDVVPLSLGIETYGGLVEKIISRNSTIPVARAQEFTTFKDNQTAMSVHVLQGERETVNDTRSLAKFSLKGIPPMVAGAARIKVGFQVDADGLLTVTAAETSTGVEAQVEVKPSFGLSDSDVEQMIVESMSHAEGDKFKRAFLEQMVDAERTLEALSAALADDGDIMLNKDELSSILGQRDALVALLNESQSASPEDAQQQSKILKQAVANLERAAEIYVSRRMDSNVQTALKGRSVEDI